MGEVPGSSMTEMKLRAYSRSSQREGGREGATYSQQSIRFLLRILSRDGGGDGETQVTWRWETNERRDQSNHWLVDESWFDHWGHWFWF